jgi:murein L,D-transpeptidase YafK
MKPLVLFCSLLWWTCPGCYLQPSSTHMETTALTQSLEELGIDPKEAEIYFSIDKANYELTVMVDTLSLMTYPVVFGRDPVQDKRMEGDLRTPEGDFKVRNHYPHDKWTYFIWIDYPTPDSYRKYEAAKTAGEIPQDASIGGEIGIHGVPAGMDHLIDEGQNWTLGCISLKNTHIKEIIPLVSKGMRVEIR